MASRAGTNSLQLAVNWQYAFVPQGSVLQPWRDTVLLDMGGALGPGVLDQHQDSSVAASAAELVLKFPEFCYGHLMNDWLRRRDDGVVLAGQPFSPTIVLHVDPDFDSLVACHLSKRLVEDGEPPPYAAALAAYASRVDQGKYAVDLARPDTARFLTGARLGRSRTSAISRSAAFGAALAWQFSATQW